MSAEASGTKQRIDPDGTAPATGLVCIELTEAQTGSEFWLILFDQFSYWVGAVNGRIKR